MTIILLMALSHDSIMTMRYGVMMSSYSQLRRLFLRGQGAGSDRSILYEDFTIRSALRAARRGKARRRNVIGTEAVRRFENEERDRREAYQALMCEEQGKGKHE